MIAEGIQTILRRAGFPQPYERLKEFTRGRDRIGQEDIAAFIDQLEVNDDVRESLRRLSPHNYTGVDLFSKATP